MGTLRVTVAGPGSLVEVALPDDIAVAAIIPLLVRGSVPGAMPWSRWALGLAGGEPFASGRSLEALGVAAGAELELRDMVAPDAPSAAHEVGTVSALPEARAGREELRQRVTELAERLAGDVAGLRAGRNPLLEYATPDARRRLRDLVPGPLDRETKGAFTGLSLAVTWHRDPLARIEALARFTEVAPGDAAGESRRPAGSRPGAAARRISVQMTLDPSCRRLVDVVVSADPPLRWR